MHKSERQTILVWQQLKEDVFSFNQNDESIHLQ